MTTKYWVMRNGVARWADAPELDEFTGSVLSGITLAPDPAGVADRTLLVWDAATQRLRPFAQTPGLSDGFSEVYLRYQPPATGWAGVDAVRPLHLEAVYKGTDADSPTHNTLQGLTSTLYVGDAGTPALGTVHALSKRVIVRNNAAAGDEHAGDFMYMRYEGGATGRAWLTDWNVHGAVGVQQSKLDGATIFVNNYYDGSPATSPSGPLWLVTRQGTGGGPAAEHLAATSYPLDVGLGIVGASGASDADQGFKVGIRVGGAGSGWNIPSSRIGTGIELTDYESYALRIGPRKGGGSAHSFVIDRGAGFMGVGMDRATGQVPLAQLDVDGTGNGGIANLSQGPVAARFLVPTNGYALYIQGGAGGAGDNVYVAFNRGRIGYAGGAIVLEDVSPTSGTSSSRDVVIRAGGTERFLAQGSTGIARMCAGAIQADVAKVGFYSAVPVVKPTVTGSRGGNAALESLLATLASFGLLNDSSTA